MARRRLPVILLLLSVLVFIWLGALTLPARANDVVVSGTCDEAATTTALDTVPSSGGGKITFNYGPNASINISAFRTITSNVTIDGSCQVTLSGGGFALLFYVAPNGKLALNNLTLSDASNNRAQRAARFRISAAWSSPTAFSTTTNRSAMAARCSTISAAAS